MLTSKTVTITIVLCVCASHVGTYPQGAPQSTCEDMTPRHGSFQPQTIEAPFSVTSSVSRINSGNRVRLMLSAEPGVSFAGFMLQARSPARPGEPVGTFTNLSEMAKALTCGSGIKDTATHKNRTLKKSLEFEWESPSDFEGPVVFNTTFVQNGAVFWVGLESEPVQVVKRSADEPRRPAVGISTTKSPVRITTVPNYSYEPDTRAERTDDPVYKDCGDKKKCFGDPSGCIDDQSCNVLSAITVKGERFEFELQAKPSTKGSPKYIALGLSNDNQMGSDSVSECVVDSSTGKVDVFMSYNNGKKNQRLNSLSDSVDLQTSSFTDGTLYCKFTRNKVTNVSGTIFDLSQDSYYLLLAAGDSENSALDYHFDRVASGTKGSLSEVAIVYSDSNADLLYRIHGCFMIIAWIGCASIGILLARYFKQTWIGSQLCGKDQWFAWHRVFMVSAWTLTCAAFIMIFVQIGGWYDVDNPHAILGCITTGLAFIQPFGAALRPLPKSPRRPIFNWLHWLVGNSAHILGIVTIFFAVKLNKAQLPLWTDWVLVSYVAFHVFMHLLFSVMGCFSDKQWEKRVNDFPLKDMSSSRNPLHGNARETDSPHSCLRKFLLAIYLIIIIALTVVLVLMVAMAPIEENWAFKEAKNLLFTQN